MKEYFINNQKVGAVNYFKRTDNKGENRHKTTKQFPCKACGNKLWITKGMYKISITKEFFCDRICDTKRKYMGENPTLRGGYINKTSGYHYIRKNGKPYLKHRAIMEQSLGRILKTEEQIHHLNGIRNDNRLENLKVVSNRDHPSQTIKYIQALQKRIRDLEKKCK